MDIALTLALIGIGLSAASLSWQVISWRASGHRLHVACVGTLTENALGENHWLVGISVTNKGRAPTVIQGVTLVLPDRKHMPLLWDALNQVQFPYTLEPGRQITAHYDQDALEAELVKRGYPSDVQLRPKASCGHGDVTGKRSQI